MAALTIAGTMLSGCSSDDIMTDTPAAPATTDNDSIVTLTTTISMEGDDGSTRALTDKGKKTFAEGEKVAVFYRSKNSNKNIITLKATSEALTATNIKDNGKSATIKVTLTNPVPKSEVRIVYPASMAKKSIDTGAIVKYDENTIDFDQLNEQDGTLATISSKYDLATYDGNLIVQSLPSKTKLTNRLAICEFSMKDGDNDVTNTITRMFVDDGSNSYLINRTTYDDLIYVAMKPVTNGKITISAVGGTNFYQKTVSGKTLAASNIYPVRLTKAKTNAIVLDFVTADYTAQDGETLTGTLRDNVKISIAEGAKVTLSNVTINGENNNKYLWAGITCLGDATLVLDGTNSVTGFWGSYPGIQPGGTGTTLTIEGTGSLTATTNDYDLTAAGIGAKNGGTCGNIIINSGTITATGLRNAAGIGSCNAATCGDITINGGTVNATGKSDAAGIGASFGGTCGNITISGTANVTATGNDGAGIGSSFGNSTCGNILIEGGTVVSKGTGKSAAIGTSRGYTVEVTSYSTCGTITITKGVTSITATKDNNADNIIGRGENDTSICGTVTIDDVTDATPESTFTNFNSELSGNTWTLKHE